MRKQILLVIGAIATVMTFSACNKGGGGGSVAVPPNSCLYYTYVPGGTYPNGGYPVGQSYPVGQTYPGNTAGGYYVNPQGVRVNCVDPYNYNQFAPYGYGYGMNGCSSWSMYFPGNTYVPAQINGQMMCVNTNYYMSLTGFQSLYNTYGSYPMYTCQWGANCHSACIGGNAGYGGGLGGSVGIGAAGGYWNIGGTLGFCW